MQRGLDETCDRPLENPVLRRGGDSQVEVGVQQGFGRWVVVDFGYFNKRVGQMYNDNGDVHEAVTIDPFVIANVFVNYTVGGTSKLSPTRIRFTVNNLLDNHSITGVTPALKTTSLSAPGDVLQMMSGRAVSVSMTVGFLPKNP